MRQSITIALLIIASLAVWGATLYLIQDWGYNRGLEAGSGNTEEARRVLLCEDALQRRIETERALIAPITLAGGIQLPLSARRDHATIQEEVDRLQVKLVSIGQDISRFCGESQPAK